MVGGEIIIFMYAQPDILFTKKDNLLLADMTVNNNKSFKKTTHLISCTK